MAKKKKAKPDFSKPKNVPPVNEENLEAEISEIAEGSEQDDFDADSGEEISEEQNIEESTEERKYGMTKKQYAGAPLLVIAGRPNVGKSTLFNRFMQRRLAIVDPTPGLCRLHEGFEEGVGWFVKDKRKTHMHTGYAKVVLHHLHLHYVLACARIAHRGKSVHYKFGI